MTRLIYIAFTFSIWITYSEAAAVMNGSEIIEKTITIRSDNKEHMVCSNLNLVCEVNPPVFDEEVILWTINNTNITANDRITVGVEDCLNISCSVLHIKCVQKEDNGNYMCSVFDSDFQRSIISSSFFLHVNVPEIVSAMGGRVRSGTDVSLKCIFKYVKPENITWSKSGDMSFSNHLRDMVQNTKYNETIVESILHVPTVNMRNHNGTFFCNASNGITTIFDEVPLFVLDVPVVTIDTVKPTGANQIFLNWTVNNGNDEITEYFLQFLKNGTDKWTYYGENISGRNTSCIVKNLEAHTTYRIKMHAKNGVGEGRVHEYQEHVTTLSNDPDFIPELSLKGVTVNSIDIGWSSPPVDVKDHVHYYKLLLYNNDIRRETVQTVEYPNNYMFGHLQSATTYYLKVQACNEFTHECRNWSKEINGTTLDGVSGPPENVNVACKYDNISGFSFIHVSWSPPKHTNGEITHYIVTSVGIAKFYNEDGESKNTTWGPDTKTARGTSTSFERVPSNTNYSIHVFGKTRSLGSGQEAVHHCMMPPTTPSKDKLNGIKWEKVEERGQWLLKLFMPRISERNGTICCYRIFLVRLEPEQRLADLPSPKDSTVFSYHYVHHNANGGTYIADMFDNNFLNKNILLGDGQSIATNYSNSQCKKCPIASPKVALITSVASVPRTSDNPSSTPQQPSLLSSYSTEKLISDKVMPSNSTYLDTLFHTISDGPLDSTSNYTGFLQLVVYGNNNDFVTTYSNYFDILKPGPQSFEGYESAEILTLIFQVLCALIAVSLVLFVGFCLLQHYTKQVAEAQGVEMTLRNSFRYLCRSLRGSHLPVSSNPPDVLPISKASLISAFAELAKDSDYGFEQEFEMLPDRFTDRTTKSSEARENACKNRYPDIKAYDQTRVKLSQIDGIIGSDYINANFVMSYKERKKFICAQGPMENTVHDFWRMIWEQHLEIILMLTNLEEYSKTKCAKYWPDRDEKCKTFEDIVIHYVDETRYSDYVIRELKVVRTTGQSKEPEERSIFQYHFLVWKDFQAPEHPSGILKFIRRVNDAYSYEKGPILVHCSAGVGRTGTLVALDSLLQQLEYEGQVLIFNTICDLRRQRNFLVQSLKQYIFVYRTLLEFAQFGNTEIKANELKLSIEKLKQTDNGKLKTRMEEEFEKLSFTLYNKDPKSTSAGTAQENAVKNRSNSIIPFDRNRVILTPVPGREHSTYINASFIEGYDNTESYIISQDPIQDVTVVDFWRMISEQSITTIIMFSSASDGLKKCPRYWPDDEALYGNVSVRHIQSESCPYYTRREFFVNNVKMDENLVVIQYQYNGWPTVEGEVPEVTRGVIELVNITIRPMPDPNEPTPSPIVVHCELGSDRSSMFVALSILAQQLRIEKRVDLVTVARKLRSQRHGMLSTYSQYEFVYRAILNYAELHHLTDFD